MQRMKKLQVKRLLIAPLFIAIAGLLGWLSEVTSIWQLKMVTGILAVLGVYVMAYVAVHPSGEQH